ALRPVAVRLLDDCLGGRPTPQDALVRGDAVAAGLEPVHLAHDPCLSRRALGQRRLPRAYLSLLGKCAVETLDVEIHGQEFLVARLLALLEPEAAVLPLDRTREGMHDALGNVVARRLGELDDIGRDLWRPGCEDDGALRDPIPD